ncbi:hypothetical protein I4U23_006286 [Adineta vaga]|nr:hypothetical protein I4U23_006286 [Adineta vaga]
MSIGDSLVLVQRAMTRYLLPIIAGFSNLGHIITILILTRKHRLANSCSIYLLAASIFGLIITNWAIIPIVYGLDNIDLVQTSLILCRLRGYIIHTCSMCFRYTIVFACIDRYAICNSRVSIRNYCRPRIAYYCIGIITITWTIISVHLLIFESIENGRCGIYGIYGRIFSIYSIICFGAIPTLSMIIFGFLLMFKLRQMRLRVQPVRDQFHLRKNETSLGKVILAEVIASIICTFCYPLMTFYLTLTNDTIPNKSSERIKIESFINFITI